MHFGNLTMLTVWQENLKIYTVSHKNIAPSLSQKLRTTVLYFEDNFWHEDTQMNF